VNLTPYVGYVAGAMTVVSYAPQALRAWKTKEVSDLSWAMLALLVVAGALWITYGVVSSQLPVVLTNVGTTLLTGAILVAKIRYR
jgi:MtN3 and saliva related transmembrane protein